MTDLPNFDPDDDAYEREVIPHHAAATERSTARRVALQALYEIDSVGHDVGDVITHRLGSQKEPNRLVSNYARQLTTGVVNHRQQLDRAIQQYAPEWPLDQVAIVDRNILRLSLYEFGVDHRTPVGVAIAEAIELAKLFGSEATPRFVNGVLGSLADNIEVVRQQLATVEVENEDKSE